MDLWGIFSRVACSECWNFCGWILLMPKDTTSTETSIAVDICYTFYCSCFCCSLVTLAICVHQNVFHLAELHAPLDYCRIALVAAQPLCDRVPRNSEENLERFSAACFSLAGYPNSAKSPSARQCTERSHYKFVLLYTTCDPHCALRLSSTPGC